MKKVIAKFVKKTYQNSKYYTHNKTHLLSDGATSNFLSKTVTPVILTLQNCRSPQLDMGVGYF